MKNIFRNTFTLSSLATSVVMASMLFVSCSEEDSVSNVAETLESGAECTIPPMLYDGDFSRAQLTLGSAGMDFHWEKDEEHPENSDRLSIFYSEADQTAGVYTLSRLNNAEHTSAKFTSEGFKLTAEKRYYAISTTEQKAPEGCRIPDKRNIELTYAGQIQRGNKNTTHLGKYAYMAASGIAEGDDHVNLDFQHLSLTLRIIMTDLPTDVEFTRMEMYDSENSYLQPLRGFDMTSGLMEDKTKNPPTWSYTPALKPVDTNSAQYKAADRFSLKLEDANNSTKGIKADGSEGVVSGRLEMFIEVPPANLTGKDIIFMVYGKDAGSKDVAYYIMCDGRNLAAGKAYQMKDVAHEATTYTVRIKVNHDWQLGNTISRATGDPGVDEKFDMPKNLYYILCVGGQVRSLPTGTDQSLQAVTEIENTTSEDWARSADNAVSTYKNQLTFNFDKAADKEAVKNVYIVASNNDLSSIFTNEGIANGTAESTVQNLVYSIQEENLGAGFTTQDNTQAFMKNLYSTPWTGDNATFIGNLGADYFKDIILYHVAAKVDLKWNSPTSVIDNDHTTVSVNNVQSTNLSLFQPATVNGTGGFVKGGEDPTYTVTSTIEEDRMFYGRQVFYLPQFATTTSPNTSTYNVTVGNKTADDVDFKPATTGGFTSWLRWLKQY